MGILETLRAENLTHNLTNKNILVTGGTQGIGAAGTPKPIHISRKA
jgi:FlaA1/EpsC-like NDP-sugar epimerase